MELILFCGFGTGIWFCFMGLCRYLWQQVEQAPLFDTKAWVDDLSACDV